MLLGGKACAAMFFAMVDGGGDVIVAPFRLLRSSGDVQGGSAVCFVVFVHLAPWYAALRGVSQRVVRSMAAFALTERSCINLGAEVLKVLESSSIVHNLHGPAALFLGAFFSASTVWVGGC